MLTTSAQEASNPRPGRLERFLKTVAVSDPEVALFDAVSLIREWAEVNAVDVMGSPRDHTGDSIGLRLYAFAGDGSTPGNSGTLAATTWRQLCHKPNCNISPDTVSGVMIGLALQQNVSGCLIVETDAPATEALVCFCEEIAPFLAHTLKRVVERESVREGATFLEGAGLPMVVYDPQRGIVKDCTEQAEDVLRLRRDQLPQATPGFVREALSSPEGTCELEVRYRGIVTRYKVIRKRVARNTSVATMVDITEHFRSQTEFHRHMLEMEQRKFELEEECRRLVGQAANMAEARNNAMQTAASKMLFLANVAHELRTPMNGVVGAASLLKETALNGEQQEFVDMLVRSGENMIAIVNDLLDLSKADAGRMKLEKKDFDLRLILDDIIKLFATQAAQKGLALNATVSRSVPDRIWGDGNRLRQIILNLVSNALKFTPTGAVYIRARAMPSGPDAMQIRFEVADTGIGIAPEALSKLFVPFEQTHKSGQNIFKGTGLGLSISSKLVNLMGGEIEVDSNVGEGTCFHFTLTFPGEHLNDAPLAGKRIALIGVDPLSVGDIDGAFQDAGAWVMSLRHEDRFHTERHEFDGVVVCASGPLDDDELQRIAQGSPLVVYGDRELHGNTEVGSFVSWPARADALANKVAAALGTLQVRHEPVVHAELKLSRTDVQVLLVEDNPLNARIAKRQLTKLGAENVVICSDGHEAIAQAKLQSWDIIFMDCILPGLDGYGASTAIRKLEAATGAYTPIIALSAHSAEAEEDRCRAAGMDGFLMKPARPEELANTINTWLERSQQAQERAAASFDEERLALLRDELMGSDFLDYLVAYLETAATHLDEVHIAFDASNPEKALGNLVALEHASESIGALGVARQCELMMDTPKEQTHGNLLAAVEELREQIREVRARFDDEMRANEDDDDMFF